MKDKSYANYFKLDMSDIDNGNITIESNFYNETVIYKNETKTDVLSEVLFDGTKENKTSVYKGYKQDKIEMRGDRAEMSDFPLYLNMVAGGLDCRDQAIGGFSFVVKIYAVPVVEIIG